LPAVSIALLVSISAPSPTLAHAGKHTIVGAAARPTTSNPPWKVLAIVYRPGAQANYVAGVLRTKPYLIKITCVSYFFRKGLVHGAYMRGKDLDGKLWYISPSHSEGLAIGSDAIQITDLPGTLPCGYSDRASKNRGLLYGAVEFRAS
jgi:hypothetical protein